MLAHQTKVEVIQEGSHQRCSHQWRKPVGSSLPLLTRHQVRENWPSRQYRSTMLYNAACGRRSRMGERDDLICSCGDGEPVGRPWWGGVFAKNPSSRQAVHALMSTLHLIVRWERMCNVFKTMKLTLDTEYSSQLGKWSRFGQSLHQTLEI